MKTSFKLFTLALSFTFISASFAADGPALSTLVPIDENKYDMDNKKLFDKNDVLHRLTKETYYREIYVVNEKITIPTKYVVQEIREQSPYVLVNPQAPQVPKVEYKWVYQSR